MSGALGENRPGFNTAVFGGQTLAADAAGALERGRSGLCTKPTSEPGVLASRRWRGGRDLATGGEDAPRQI